jgi:hypothetical protein
MHVESVDTPSLLELRAIVAQRLQAYGAFEGCSAANRVRTLFTSVGNEADRIGPTEPIGFTHLGSDIL